MMEKNKQVIKLILWAGLMILILMLSIFIKSRDTFKPNESDKDIVYDGSETNPYIEGVQ